MKRIKKGTARSTPRGNKGEHTVPFWSVKLTYAAAGASFRDMFDSRSM